MCPTKIFQQPLERTLFALWLGGQSIAGVVGGFPGLHAPLHNFCSTAKRFREQKPLPQHRSQERGSFSVAFSGPRPAFLEANAAACSTADRIVNQSM